MTAPKMLSLSAERPQTEHLKSGKKHAAGRQKAIRILVAAAVVVLSVLAFFIPAVVSDAQDLKIGSRQTKYKAGEVSLSSGRSGFLARLQCMQITSMYGYISIDGGKNFVDEAGAVGAAQEELAVLSKILGEALLPGEADDIGAAAFMTTTLGSSDTFLIWDVTFFSEKDAWSVSVILDDATGKILSLSVFSGGPEDASYVIIKNGSETETNYAAEGIADETDLWLIAEGMADYYDITFRTIDMLESSRSEGYAVYDSGYGTVILPMSEEPAFLTFNMNPNTYPMEYMYGESARDLAGTLREAEQ